MGRGGHTLCECPVVVCSGYLGVYRGVFALGYAQLEIILGEKASIQLYAIWAVMG